MTLIPAPLSHRSFITRDTSYFAARNSSCQQGMLFNKDEEKNALFLIIQMSFSIIMGAVTIVAPLK